jgi:hypothetical protein
LGVGSFQLAVGSWQLAVGSFQLAVFSWQFSVGSLLVAKRRLRRRSSAIHRRFLLINFDLST